MRAQLRKRAGRLAMIAALVLATAGGVAYATIPDSSGLIHGCYSKFVGSGPTLVTTGQLRVIDTDLGQTCKPTEQALNWNQSGPPGPPGPPLSCPAGTTAFIGVCIDSSARTADAHDDAEEDCADEGRRLPSGGELTAFNAQATLATGGEWTDDLGATEGAFRYFFVAENGNGVKNFFEDLAYRCVAGLVG
jgi:hypothetical protein